jgi:hypothetical protein
MAFFLSLLVVVVVVWATAFDLATRLVRKVNALHAA